MMDAKDNISEELAFELRMEFVNDSNYMSPNYSLNKANGVIYLIHCVLAP